MAKDLRSFIADVKDLGPSYYMELSKEVDPVLQISTLQELLGKEERYPVMYFKNVKGSDMPLVTNTFASYDLLGSMFGIKPGDTLVILGDAERGLAIPPKEQFGEWINAVFDGGTR